MSEENSGSQGFIRIPIFQRMLDNPFLLLFIGVVVPAVFYIIWSLIMFIMMPLWHVYGKQNLSNDAYKTTPEAFQAKAMPFRSHAITIQTGVFQHGKGGLYLPSVYKLIVPNRMHQISQ